jgi:hypothetical protein
VAPLRPSASATPRSAERTGADQEQRHQTNGSSDQQLGRTVPTRGRASFLFPLRSNSRVARTAHQSFRLLMVCSQERRELQPLRKRHSGPPGMGGNETGVGLDVGGEEGLLLSRGDMSETLARGAPAFAVKIGPHRWPRSQPRAADRSHRGRSGRRGELGATDGDGQRTRRDCRGEPTPPSSCVYQAPRHSATPGAASQIAIRHARGPAED